MNKNVALFFLLLGCMLGANSQNNQANKNTYATQIVKEDDDEEGDKMQRRRKLWFEEMHRSAPGADWRVIEAQNMLGAFEKRKAARKNSFTEKWLNIPGVICGSWEERGSINQAGRCDAVDYDSSTNKLYVMGDGGALFEGTPDSANWQPLNDQLQFNNYIIKVIKNAGGGNRLLACIGVNMYYSDDNGADFTASGGITFPVAWGGNGPVQLISLNDSGSVLYLLAQAWDTTPWAPRYWLYASFDRGQTWKKIYTFYCENENEIWMWQPQGQQSMAYALLNYDSLNTSTLFSITDTVVTTVHTSTDLPVNVDLEFGGNKTGSTTTMYALANDDSLYQSTNLGSNWTLAGVTPANIYTPASFIVAPDNANKMMAGGVNAYYSYDGGASWTEVNDWSSYYGDPADSLHADIRYLQFFKRSNGTSFLMVNCDGGCYRSDDEMQSVHNIGLNGLRVGQFYDAIADMQSDLFGGTQDQGFQRTDSTGANNGLLAFNQVLSGDYGKLQLTSNYQTLWTEYPGGNMYYYYDAYGPYTNNYSLPGTTLPLYGWMLATAAVYPAYNNEILLGGGNITGGSGSYLVVLNGTPDTIYATQINHDFNGASGYGISAIATTPLDTNRIYVAREDGKFFYSTNFGNTWNETSLFTGPDPFYDFGACIFASRKTPNLVWFGGSGYSNPGVYKSTNGGVSFSADTSGLPATLVYGLTANSDESLLFAATDAGPYVYSVANNVWYALDEGIAPVQSYFAVNYDSVNNTAHFSTYGRGVWDFVMNSTAPLITQNGDTLKSSAPYGNQWYLNGAAITGAINPFYIVHQNGSYYTLVTDTNGCGSHISDTIQFINSGITNPSTGTLNVHPNPSDGMLTVNLAGTGNLAIKIFNTLGQEVYSQPLNPGEQYASLQIDMADAANGIYILQVVNYAGQLSRKLAIQK